MKLQNIIFGIMITMIFVLRINYYAIINIICKATTGKCYNICK